MNDQPFTLAGAPGEPLAQPTADTLGLRPSRKLWQDALQRLLHDRTALTSGFVLLAIVLSAVFAPQLAPYDPNQISLESLAAPSAQHIFGTDHIGRDVFSRVLYGGRLSLQVGIISVGISLTFGLPLGLLAGYREGWIDMVIMRLMDVMLAFPGILLALAVIAILGAGLTNVMIAVGLSYISHYVRIVRASVLSTKNSVYVDAARVIGCRDARILTVHILPNVLTPVITVAMLGVATSVLTAASLSYLGLGVQPPTPEWGAMVSVGREYLRDQWWISTFPGLTIVISVLALNLLGDSLHDAVDPKRRRR